MGIQVIKLKGKAFPQGESGTMQIGTVTTVEPNASAEVINRGTSTNAILDFKIPKGDKGDTGSVENAYTKAETDAKFKNTSSESTTDGYSADYINDNFYTQNQLYTKTETDDKIKNTQTASTTSTYCCSYINNTYRAQALQAYIYRSTFNMYTDASYLIPITTAMYQLNSGILIDNVSTNKIKIGNNINHVEVTYNVYIDVPDNVFGTWIPNVNIKTGIKKNDSSTYVTGSTQTFCYVSSKPWYYHTKTVIVPVTSGDVLSLYFEADRSPSGVLVGDSTLFESDIIVKKID